MSPILKDIIGYTGIILLFLSPIIAIILEEWSKAKGVKNENNTNEGQSVNQN